MVGVQVLVSVDMGKGHFRDNLALVVSEPPFAPAVLGFRTGYVTIYLSRLIPKSAWVENLLEVLSEDRAGEVRHILVSEWREQKPVALTSTGRALCRHIYRYQPVLRGNFLAVRAEVSIYLA